MRKQNWPTLLQDFINKRRKMPFKRGTNDCAMFAVCAAKAMTGDDFAGALRQTYKSKGQADKVLKTEGFSDLEQVATERLGEPYPSPAFAKRGDCVSIHGDEGVALAIVDLSGQFAITMGKQGMLFYPMKEWKMAWSIE